MNSAGNNWIIFTLGYQGFKIEEFVSKLQDISVAVLIDVRKNAISRKKGFSKSKLSQTLIKSGIEYYHLPELGVPSLIRKKLDKNDPETYSQLFRYYDENIIPSAKKSIKQIKQLAAEKKRVALTCFEADSNLCHRHRITKNIERDKLFRKRVQHI